jgi:beta-aspartyl-peptidase (threonine type)
VSAYAIAIHGGAGAIPRATLSAAREQRYRAGLEAALDGGY